MSNNILRTEYGMCPKCNGNGWVFPTGISSTMTETCNYCNGTKTVVTASETKALNEDTVVYNQLGERVTDYKEENVDSGMPITKTMNSVEAYNEGYVQGVKFCEKYGIPKHQIGAGKSTKPPLGLLPKHIWEEQRIWDIAAAIERYKEAGKEIPQEWINENYDLRKIPKPKTDTVVEDKSDYDLVLERLKQSEESGVHWMNKYYALLNKPEQPPNDTGKDSKEWQICAVRDTDGKLFYTDMLPTKGETIEAVKRLSDNTVFTIGDKVYETITGNVENWIISEFSLKDTRCFSCGININNFEKVPKVPSTVTTDNSDVAILTLKDLKCILQEHSDGTYRGIENWTFPDNTMPENLYQSALQLVTKKLKTHTP